MTWNNMTWQAKTFGLMVLAGILCFVVLLCAIVVCKCLDWWHRFEKWCESNKPQKHKPRRWHATKKLHKLRK